MIPGLYTAIHTYRHLYYSIYNVMCVKILEFQLSRTRVFVIEFLIYIYIFINKILLS